MLRIERRSDRPGGQKMARFVMHAPIHTTDTQVQAISSEGGPAGANDMRAADIPALGISNIISNATPRKRACELAIAVDHIAAVVSSSCFDSRAVPHAQNQYPRTIVNPTSSTYNHHRHHNSHNSHNNYAYSHGSAFRRFVAQARPYVHHSKDSSKD
ncbi:hypothetical protein TGAM01_v211026 [Trichoderma gamsii]|uniref:Uncharacterized protein n=1 Tax=Trichoderma gamsii TaxID=398673 RepID=A0A2P4Z749_9HYPO|nr:hypothetical protein TGAM01_v211026 [Trichoderma gamsii]PON20103.1 hypothetical protein TGAM01_v211026 [Trichoderma gamsii]